MIRWLYPHHANPRDLGLYPWLEVLRNTERGFVCACCGVKQHPWRPMVFVCEHLGIGDVQYRVKYRSRVAKRTGRIVPWCVSCAWKLCGRKMVHARRWYEFWRWSKAPLEQSRAPRHSARLHIQRRRRR